MNPTHIHLLVTHLPIFASILGGLVLAHGIWTKSNPTKTAAYYIFILAAIGAGISYITGEPAEETVENITGISKNMVEEHEDFALYALVSFILLGVASLVGLFLNYRKSTINSFPSLVLFISLISFGLVGWTGYLGGQIRHTEINNGTSIEGPDVDEDD